MKKKLLLLALLALGVVAFAQNPDLVTDSLMAVSPDTANISFPSFDDYLQTKTELTTQRFLKNLFLIGFVFTAVLLLTLVFVYVVKVKKIVKSIEQQEDAIITKSFQIEQLSIILNNIFDAAFIIDKQGNILWANSVFFDLFGLKPAKDLNLNDFTENLQVNLHVVNEKKKTYQYETVLKHNGKTVKVLRRIIPFIHDKDQVIENYAIIDKILK